MKYIHTKLINLNVRQLYKDCLDFEKIILENWESKRSPDLIFPDLSKTTELHAYYNLLHFPHDQLHILTFEIRNMFYEMIAPVHRREHYYISMWLNVHRKNEYIDWHNHSDTQNNSYHGFFTVFAEPSTTEYRLPDGTEQAVPARNNQLVISPSAGDEHRTTVWLEDAPRVTLAFDIIPSQLARTSFNTQNRINNWIPL